MKATAAFWRLSTALCCKDLSLQQRFDEFFKRVTPVALYGSGAWVWSRAVYNELVRWENAHLRKIIAVKRNPNLDFATFICKATNKARELYLAQGRLSFTTQFADNLHRTAARKFARVCVHAGETSLSSPTQYYALVAFPVQDLQTQLPSQCFVAATVLWCDWEWWQFRQAVGIQHDPQCTELAWRHDRPGPQLRWEHVFIKTFGDHWKREAASTQWKQHRGTFRHRAYQMFQARPFEDHFAKKVAIKEGGSLPRK